MEAMDIVLAATRDLSYTVVNHPIYSAIGCFAVAISLLRFYCRLTVGLCDSDQDMTGKTVLITGGSSGIGKASALDLARRNARVILACRNAAKAQRVADEIVSSTGNKSVVVKQLDLSSFNSVRRCAEDVFKTEEKLHVLINNAGIFELLKKSSPSRIINVSSSAYTLSKLDVDDMAGKNCKKSIEVYSRSKLANVLFTTELAKRLESTGVTVNAVHPGIVKTDIALDAQGAMGFLTKILMIVLGKSAEEGAQTTIYLAVHPAVEKATGKYFSDCKEEKLVGEALNKSLAKQLFEVSEKMVGATYKRT